MTPSNANTDYAGLIAKLEAMYNGPGSHLIAPFFGETASALRELLAENARLVGEVEESWASANDVVGARDTKIVGLEVQVKALRDVLNNVQHGILCPAQAGWRDAGPCNCGLDAALNRSKP